VARNHKPSKVSQAVARDNGDVFRRSGNGHQCSKSPSGSHWWKIGSPEGANSNGVCKYCGEHRQFVNTLDVSRVWRARK